MPAKSKDWHEWVESLYEAAWGIEHWCLRNRMNEDATRAMIQEKADELDQSLMEDKQ